MCVASRLTILTHTHTYSTAAESLAKEFLADRGKSLTSREYYFHTTVSAATGETKLDATASCSVIIDRKAMKFSFLSLFLHLSKAEAEVARTGLCPRKRSCVCKLLWLPWPMAHLFEMGKCQRSLTTWLTTANRSGGKLNMKILRPQAGRNLQYSVGRNSLTTESGIR